MGRMHSGGKGIAGSALPYKRTPPSWSKATPAQVEDHVNKLAKRGLTPSQVSAALLHCGPQWENERYATLVYFSLSIPTTSNHQVHSYKTHL